MLNKETPKNTMIRDENGNIREGVKWYLELMIFLYDSLVTNVGIQEDFKEL